MSHPTCPACVAGRYATKTMHTVSTYKKWLLAPSIIKMKDIDGFLCTVHKLP